MHITNFVSKIDKKNILRGINFINLKTPGGYITKLKFQRDLFATESNTRSNYAI